MPSNESGGTAQDSKRYRSLQRGHSPRYYVKASYSNWAIQNIISSRKRREDANICYRRSDKERKQASEKEREKSTSSRH